MSMSERPSEDRRIKRRDSDMEARTIGKRRSSSLAPVGPEPPSFEESRFKALPPKKPDAKSEAR